MKTLNFTFVFLFVFLGIVSAQFSPSIQQKINSNISSAFNENAHKNQKGNNYIPAPNSQSNAFQILKKMEDVKKTHWEKYKKPNQARVLDTIYVGLVPNDTLWITGTYLHEGPIFIFNDGVLIFVNADATNYGDIFVFEHGTLLGLNSTLTFPQQYFYERSLLVVQNGSAYFNNCSFDYSGIQHNLVIGNSGAVVMENVHQDDWTTAGLFGSATFLANGLNLGGEYILTDTCSTSFTNVDTLLLWHKMPETAIINHAFPQGDTVYNYLFSNAVTGVAGLTYQVYADTCHTVWWGIMPTNGSDVTISNSNIRAVGNWFERGDTATMDGIYNNTFYPNTSIPLADRNLQLLNTFVQTWSAYVFDSSQVFISNCTLGEVGTQKFASVVSTQFILDGSGGYFWATDTSTTFASNVTIYSTARSERSGFFVLAYSNLPFQSISSVNKSVMVSVQNALAFDPVAYDESILWLQNIESPSIAHTDSLIPIMGSAWIDQGPLGNSVHLNSYSLYFQLQGDSSWTPIVTQVLSEVFHSLLATWNTSGLQAGNYILRLQVKNNYGDSVNGFAPLTMLLGSPVNIIEINNGQFITSPNPCFDKISIFSDNKKQKPTNATYTLMDICGKTLENKQIFFNNNHYLCDMSAYAKGIYFLNISYLHDGKSTIETKKIIKQ